MIVFGTTKHSGRRLISARLFRALMWTARTHFNPLISRLTDTPRVVDALRPVRIALTNYVAKADCTCGHDIPRHLQAVRAPLQQSAAMHKVRLTDRTRHRIDQRNNRASKQKRIAQEEYERMMDERGAG
ncbi:hypothetical protein EAG_06523 [Camponotus floridanus]|uniref:Uncharacterized protein n=1 Tax=Camponotus floridanus TaxID=104421 RepID=E1ZX37_CAMFO|nr:hypothetical protein EAG_06523 [Camponotus floridanus]